MAPGYPRLRLGAAILCIALPITSVTAEPPVATAVQRLGVRSPAQIVRDKDGIPHLFAASETDLVYLQGYAHARDRLFQMDVFRRQAEGTLSAILGPGALSSDAQQRTFGLRRAAERSLPLLTFQLSFETIDINQTLTLERARDATSVNVPERSDFAGT